MKTTTTHEQQLQTILTANKSIRDLERNNAAIKKNFKENTNPGFKMLDLYTVSRIDNGALFQITEIGTANGYNTFKSNTQSALNYLYDIKDTNEDNRVKFDKMIEADNGMMFVYILVECGKNRKAKKIGGRNHVMTEFEMEQAMINGLLVKEGE